MKLDQIETPAALIDRPRMMRNIERMQAHMNALCVAFLGESIGMAAELYEGVCTDLPPQRKK
ncbi:hypothetical protein [Caballeronia sp. M23-90]